MLLLLSLLMSGWSFFICSFYVNICVVVLIFMINCHLLIFFLFNGLCRKKENKSEPVIIFIRILVWNILMILFPTFYFYASFWHVMWFYYDLHTCKVLRKYTKTKDANILSDFEMQLWIFDDGSFTSYISFRKRILRY